MERSGIFYWCKKYKNSKLKFKVEKNRFTKKNLK